MSGKRFGHLLVVKRSGSYIAPCGQTKPQWECKCDCGKTVVVTGAALRRGKSMSCGCAGSRGIGHVKKHGDTNSRLYSIWCGIRSRCNNPNRKVFPDYGGRGIKLCPEWDDYSTFREWALANGYTEQMSIERKDVNGDYSPANCTWIPRPAQANNRRSSLMYTYHGKTQNLMQWSKECGINYPTLRFRLVVQNWDFERAISEPVARSHRR